ncbi:MAG: hypothetical protein ACIWVG_31540, partial [Gloeotrichia echinulata HAB0833]
MLIYLGEIANKFLAALNNSLRAWHCHAPTSLSNFGHLSFVILPNRQSPIPNPHPLFPRKLEKNDTSR